MHAKTLGTLVAAATLLAGAAPALAQTRPAPPPPPGAMAPQATAPAPRTAPPARRMVRRQPHMSCSARMHEIRLAWEQMPASPTKNQVAAAYNEANHARKAGNEAACQQAIAQIQLAR